MIIDPLLSNIIGHVHNDVSENAFKIVVRAEILPRDFL